MIRNFTLTNALGASFSLMNAQQGAFFEPQGLGFDDATQYEQVGEFFAPLTPRYRQQVISGSMVFGSQPYEHYLTFTKFCQHAPLSLVYETDAGTFQIPCRLTKIEKGDTDGWTYLNCKVEFTTLARMYKTVVANNTGTAGGGKVYLAKDLPDITGSIITIENAEAGEVLNITADINPIQDLHGISGRNSVGVVDCGKNLQNWTYTSLVQGNTWFNGAGNNKWEPKFTIPNAWYGQTFTYSVHIESGADSGLCCRVWFYKGSTIVGSSISGNTISANTEGKSSVSFTIPNDGTVDSIALGLMVKNATVTQPMIEVGSTATPYTPYNGTTYTTTLPSTTYGGMLDVVSGVLTVDRVSIDLTQGMSGETISGNYLYYTQVPDAKTVPNSQIANVISEAYSAIRYNGVATTVGTIAIRDNHYLYVNTGGQDILPTGKAVYELATPTTYQLTPQQIQTLLGTNNVWANSGDITITGRKTYGYKYNYTYGNFVADTVTIDSDSATSSPCRITIFGECTQPTWRHYLDGNSVATGYYNGTIPSGHKLVIDTTSSPYSIEEQDMAGNLIADRYELCDFSTERFFLLEYGHNTISVSHTDPDSIRLMVEGYIFYETV